MSVAKRLAPKGTGAVLLGAGRRHRGRQGSERVELHSHVANIGDVRARW